MTDTPQEELDKERLAELDGDIKRDEAPFAEMDIEIGFSGGKVSEEEAEAIEEQEADEGHDVSDVELDFIVTPPMFPGDIEKVYLSAVLEYNPDVIDNFTGVTVNRNPVTLAVDSQPSAAQVQEVINYRVESLAKADALVLHQHSGGQTIATVEHVIAAALGKAIYVFDPNTSEVQRIDSSPNWIRFQQYVTSRIPLL